MVIVNSLPSGTVTNCKINKLYLESILTSQLKSREVVQGIVYIFIAFNNFLADYVLQNGHGCFQFNNSTQLYLLNTYYKKDRKIIKTPSLPLSW